METDSPLVNSAWRFRRHFESRHSLSTPLSRLIHPLRLVHHASLHPSRCFHFMDLAINYSPLHLTLFEQMLSSNGSGHCSLVYLTSLQPSRCFRLTDLTTVLRSVSTLQVWMRVLWIRSTSPIVSTISIYW